MALPPIVSEVSFHRQKRSVNLPSLYMNTLTRARRVFPFRVLNIKPSNIVDLGATVSLPSGYHYANPSLVRYGDGYIACVRCVNYVYRSPRSLAVDFTAGSNYHTLNRLVLLDKHFRPERQFDTLNAQLDNVEDVRLFMHAGQLRGIGTQPTAEGAGACRMCLLSFDADLNGVQLQPLESPYDGMREKNWCPFSIGDELGFLYACEPEVFVRLPASASRPVAFDGQQLPAAEKLRFLDCGSAPAQLLDGQYIFIVHRRSVQVPSLRRVYTSRLYAVSPDLQRVRRSAYFRMGLPTIEFVSGMQLSTNEVLLTYGVCDRQALIARFDRTEFLGQLPLR
jgi:hypothetical protein